VDNDPTLAAAAAAAATAAQAAQTNTAYSTTTSTTTGSTGTYVSTDRVGGSSYGVIATGGTNF
jgi:hypothetical protein